MQKDEIYLSIIVPAYNEEHRLPSSIAQMRSFLKTLNVRFEVLIVVNRSSDRTVEVATKAIDGDPSFSILENSGTRGKGYAVRTGMLAAKGKFLFFTDADLSTPLTEIPLFLKHFDQNSSTDVVIGSRQHAQSEILVSQRFMRKNMGRIFNFFVRLFGLRGISDTQCGFKAFRKVAAQRIFSRQKLNGFSFDVEVLLLAEALKYKIEVLPVTWTNNADSRVRIVHDSIKMIRDLMFARRMVRLSMIDQPATDDDGVTDNLLNKVA